MLGNYFSPRAETTLESRSGKGKWGFSLQEQVEWTLRVASLCVGLAVGIMSLVSMVKKMRGR
jgi:hypothetical protein